MQLKQTSRKGWKVLASETGVPLGNLHYIARGLKGWGPETGIKLMKIGVDLNDQARAYEAAAKARAASEKRRKLRQRRKNQ